MIEVEKNTSISQAIPLEPLILMSKNKLVGVPDNSPIFSLNSRCKIDMPTKNKLQKF